MRTTNLIVLAFAIAPMSGCATSQYRPPASNLRYQQMLATWKGHDINELITSWGPPTSTYTMPNGNKMYTWSNIKVGPTITNGSSFAQVNPGYAGAAYGFGSSNSVSFTPTWDCFTTAVVTSSGTILSWTYKGNDCVLSYTDAELKKNLESMRLICENLHKGDLIRLKPYELSNDASSNSIENREVYFQHYNKSLDQIAFSDNEKRVALVQDEFYHLEFLEDIKVLRKNESK